MQSNDECQQLRGAIAGLVQDAVSQMQQLKGMLEQMGQTEAGMQHQSTAAWYFAAFNTSDQVLGGLTQASNSLADIDASLQQARGGN